MLLDGYTKDFTQQLKITLTQVNKDDWFHNSSINKLIPTSDNYLLAIITSVSG